MAYWKMFIERPGLYTWLYLLIKTLTICCVTGQGIGDPMNVNKDAVYLRNEYTTANPDDVHPCDLCHWISPCGAYYDLSNLCKRPQEAKLREPLQAKIIYGICQRVPCGDSDAQFGCIHVPGNPPTSTGSILSFHELERNIPGKGIQLLLSNGEKCGDINKNRRTVVDMKCEPNRYVGNQILAAWEGEGPDICEYHIIMKSHQACPTKKSKYAKLQPSITAVTGCVDSSPKLTTSQCSPGGDTILSIHGKDFIGEPYSKIEVSIEFGSHQCQNPVIVDMYTIHCSIAGGHGEDLKLSATFKLIESKPDGDQKVAEEIFITSSSVAISFKPSIDYHHHFESFMDLGVGGLTKQIKELYQRAFASRGIPASILVKLGIDHAKGILLHGPPGSGKTLLARTIARILNTEQVKLINAPEIMSKFVGESEKNLRGHFEEAEKAWNSLGDASDLYVIVIDEIDAICKPRDPSIIY